MRLVTRSSVSLVEQRREQSRRRRAAAGSLGDSFPQVQRLRIRLTFQDSAGPAPTGQIHDVYPPAPAIFEFPCPHGGCDGGFDLTNAARSVMAASRTSAEGSQPCGGSRLSQGPARQPCSLRLSYRMAVQFEAPSGP